MPPRFSIFAPLLDRLGDLDLPKLGLVVLGAAAGTLLALRLCIQWLVRTAARSIGLRVRGDRDRRARQTRKERND
jgi:hypothetical protein